jgi:hypothetical protein
MPLINWARSLVVCLFVLFPLEMRASSVQGAVVTRVEGDARILFQKNAKPQPVGTQSVQIEGQVYFVRPAKRGDRPSSGDFVIAGKDGKVRLIFRNGDQVTVSPDSAYKFSWESSDKNPVADLLYGAVRAVISPEGPRSGMQLKTRSAVMGVRGTDFFASSWSKSGGSKVVVVRGKVALVPKEETTSSDVSFDKAVEVAAGSSGVMLSASSSPTKDEEASAKTPASPSRVSVASTTKEELVLVQQESSVSKTKPSAADVSTPIEQELAELEKTAKETTLSEIKLADPVLYAALQKQGTNELDSEDIQSASVKKVFEQAPSDSKSPRKPTLKDLETGGDVYEKYKWRN